MSELDRRIDALEKRLRIPASSRQDYETRDRDAILAIYRRLWHAGGRELVESVLTEQSDAPLLDELIRKLEELDLVDEAERVVRGGPSH
ncbi:MAG: hypothetical protein ABIO99_01365 [Candidatus Limnocylindria bacterium]